MIKHMNNRELFSGKLTELQAENSAKNLLESDRFESNMVSYPRRIVIELTNRCNLNCIMCGRTGRDFKKTDFQMDWFKKIEKVFNYSEEIVLHGWGEPLMHREFDEILRYLNGFPIRKYFCTNGMLIKKHLDTILYNHMDIIAFSLDGATPEKNNKIRKGSDFNEIISAIKALVSHKSKNGISYPYINFVFTAMLENIHELPAMVDLADSLGVPEVKVVYLTAFDEELAKSSLFNKQDIVRKYFDMAGERAEQKSILLKLPYIQSEDPAGEEPHRRCYFPFRDLFIGSDGYIRPCVSNSRRLFNIDSVASLDSIWNHDAIKKLRKEYTPECLACYHSSCANWNRRSAFLQLSNDVLPEWEI